MNLNLESLKINFSLGRIKSIKLIRQIRNSKIIFVTFMIKSYVERAMGWTIKIEEVSILRVDKCLNFEA